MYRSNGLVCFVPVASNDGDCSRLSPHEEDNLIRRKRRPKEKSPFQEEVHGVKLMSRFLPGVVKFLGICHRGVIGLSLTAVVC